MRARLERQQRSLQVGWQQSVQLLHLLGCRSPAHLTPARAAAAAAVGWMEHMRARGPTSAHGAEHERAPGGLQRARRDGARGGQEGDAQHAPHALQVSGERLVVCQRQHHRGAGVSCAIGARRWLLRLLRRGWWGPRHGVRRGAAAPWLLLLLLLRIRLLLLLRLLLRRAWRGVERSCRHCSALARRGVCCVGGSSRGARCLAPSRLRLVPQRHPQSAQQRAHATARRHRGLCARQGGDLEGVWRCAHGELQLRVGAVGRGELSVRALRPLAARPKAPRPAVEVHKAQPTAAATAVHAGAAARGVGAHAGVRGVGGKEGRARPVAALT